MNCAGFERWLNDGMSPAEAGEAKSHAVRCPICARAWDVQRSIDSLLGETPAPAPSSFADTVMMRIAADRKVQCPQTVGLETSEFPWWARVFADPSVVLALAVASVLVGWGGKLLSRGPSIASELGRIEMPAWFPFVSGGWFGPHLATATWSGTLILAGVVLLSVGLYRRIARVTSA